MLSLGWGQQRWKLSTPPSSSDSGCKCGIEGSSVRFYKQDKSYLFFKVCQSHILPQKYTVPVVNGQHVCSCVKLSWKICVVFIRALCNLNDRNTFFFPLKTCEPPCRIMSQGLLSTKAINKSIYHLLKFVNTIGLVVTFIFSIEHFSGLVFFFFIYFLYKHIIFNIL